MKSILATALVAAGIVSATATEVQLDLGPDGDRYGIENFGSVDDLNGLSANGHVAFDVRFSDFIRFTRQSRIGDGHAGTGFFGLAAVLDTTITSFAGAVGTTYSLDANGERNSPIVVNNFRDRSSGGPFNFGFVDPIFYRGSTDSFPTTFYGAHFDFFFPNEPGERVTGLRFFASANNYWAVGPQIPDSGSTVVLFVFGLLVAIVLQRQPK